jgi:hypothetical protein
MKVSNLIGPSNRKEKTLPVFMHLFGSGGGTRTPDTRIMIPLL